MGRVGSHTGHVAAAPDDVFAAVTDIAGLPNGTTASTGW